MPNLQPGGPGAAFSLCFPLQPARLGYTCQVLRPRRYSWQGHEGTQASPPWHMQGSSTALHTVGAREI